MRILVVGSGGREHALAWKLAQNPDVDKMFAAPGNAGIGALAECVSLDVSDHAAVAGFAESNGVDLTVIGPEAPLVAGLADALAARELPVFGPTAAAARIEGSKGWAKQIMESAGVPTAKGGSFTEPEPALAMLRQMEAPYVVKADGLAAGKGVAICDTLKDAEAAVRASLESKAFGAAGETVVIEEFLPGEELSIFCLTDGRTVLPLAEARDHKRAFDGDVGPNTGGMGAYSPVPDVPRDLIDRAVKDVFEPTVRGLAAAGAPYTGVLYGGLMLTPDGPKVLEYNARFGDPETQAILPRLSSDLADLLAAAANGTLASQAPEWTPRACITVVIASKGYPGEPSTGYEIGGIDEAVKPADVRVFHAGTAARNGTVLNSGGRVLGVSALGDDLTKARERAYEACEKISFKGAWFRRDIAARAAQRQKGE